MKRATRWLVPTCCCVLLGGCGGSATAPPIPTPTQPPASPNTASPSVSHHTPPPAVTSPNPASAAIAAPNRDALPAIKGQFLLAALSEEAPPDETDSKGNLLDYLWQPAKETPAPDEPLTVEVPLGLNPLPGAYVPLGNPLTKAKWELGRQLYFDPRLSADTTVACATCHNPEKGWTDQAPVSTGIKGQKGGRSAPTVLNTVYGRLMFWDGRAPSLEGQSQGPPLNPIEMGNANYKQIVERFREIPGYQEQFKKVYGTEVTIDGMAKAIATFERTALTGNSAYDKYVNGDLKALTESQKRGMLLFGLRLPQDEEFTPKDVTLKKANCTSCHSGFNFSDEQFHNLGVGYDAKAQTFADLGRWKAMPIGAKFDSDIGSFKTPTLRDLKHTAPYMHDGSETNLVDVVKFYNRGGNANRYLDPDMRPLNLTDQEIADVAAFMEALNGVATKVELPKLPSGPDGKAPDARSALTPPKPPNTASAAVHGIFVR